MWALIVLTLAVLVYGFPLWHSRRIPTPIEDEAEV